MKMKTKLVKLLTLLLVISIFLTSLIGCGGDEAPAGDATKLSFKAALEYDYLKGLDGKQVTINGYMATSSPVDGSFMFLMNLPYQSCPFCVPNTSQLSNTMEIYPKKGDSFTIPPRRSRLWVLLRYQKAKISLSPTNTVMNSTLKSLTQPTP